MVYCSYGVVLLTTTEPPIRPFPFLRLPSLVQKRVLLVADALFRLHLSLTSKRMGVLVGTIKQEDVGILCALENDVFEVIVHDKHELFGFIRKRPKFIKDCLPIPERLPRLLLKGKESNRREELTIEGRYRANRCRRFDENHVRWDAASTVESAAALMTQLYAMLSLERSVLFRLNMDVINKEDISQLLSFPIFKNCEAVEIGGSHIDSETLKSLMSMPNVLHLHVRADIPSDFHHPRAFGFRHATYKTTSWIKLEDLISGKFERLTLGRTKFDSSHMNRFLLECATNGYSMIGVSLYLRVCYEPNIIVNGLVCLRLIHPKFKNHKNTAVFLIASKKTVDSVEELALVVLEQDRMFGFIKVFDDFFPGRRKIMQLLHQKNDLEKEREDVEQETVACQNLLPHLERHSHEEWIKLVRLGQLEHRRRDIRRKLEEVDEKLEKEQVHFKYGYAVQEIDE